MNSDRKMAAATGGLLILFVTALNVPYAALMSLFEYDDILRQPAGAVLTKFHEGGGPLVYAWLGFAFAALAFAPLSRAIESAFGLRPGWYGVASSLVQFAGLARWVFVVPVLAASYVEATSTPDARFAIETTYRAIHQLMGVAIGEVLGQVLLMAWSARVGLHLVQTGRVLLGGFGLATVPLWLLGLSEALHTAIPSFPVIEAAVFAFMAFELWLLVLGGALIRRSMRGTEPA